MHHWVKEMSKAKARVQTWREKIFILCVNSHLLDCVVGIRQGLRHEQETDGNRSVWVSARPTQLRPHTSILLPQAPQTPPNLIWRQWVQLHGSHGGQLCSSGSATHTDTHMDKQLWFSLLFPSGFFFMRQGVITFNLSDDALISPAGHLWCLSQFLVMPETDCARIPPSVTRVTVFSGLTWKEIIFSILSWLYNRWFMNNKQWFAFAWKSYRSCALTWKRRALASDMAGKEQRKEKRKEGSAVPSTGEARG